MSKSIVMVIAKDNHIGCSEQYVWWTDLSMKYQKRRLQQAVDVGKLDIYDPEIQNQILNT